MYDVIIVGGGPIGLACGIEAARAGLKYMIIEKGCPVNSLYNYPVNMTFFSSSKNIEIGGIPFVSVNNRPTRLEALEYYRRTIEKELLQIRVYEEVKSIDKDKSFFTITTEKESYRSSAVIIATGFFDVPNILNIPGEELPKVTHYYKEPHPYAFRDIVIIGGGNSAVDAALEINRKGGRVSMVLELDDIDENVKYWVRPDIINRIKEGSITVYANSKVVKITEKEVVIESTGGVKKIRNDAVLAMTGYRTNFDFLEKAGVELLKNEYRTPRFDEETQETNVKGLYLAGVVCSGFETQRWFIENSRLHAEKIVTHLKHKREQ